MLSVGAWLVPFADLGADTVTMENTSSTDHMSFDRVGIPGFQFVQDRMDYMGRTHHSNVDTFDHLNPEDMKQSAVVLAWFIWQAANRDELLPREPVAVENSVMPPLIPTTMGTPFYPRQAIREAKEGRAVVCFEVNSAGHISNPEFLELSDEVFRHSTLGALQRSRYKGWNDPTIVRPACRSFQYFLDSIY